MRNSDKEFMARATVKINAPVARVWQALVDPHMIKQYMFGTDVVTDWQEGSANSSGLHFYFT